MIGKKTNMHFQSLIDNLENNETYEKEQEKETKAEIVKSECPNCQRLFQNLLKHISRSTCKSKIEESVVLELKQTAKMKHKAQNKEHKASSRKNLEMHETNQKREERLVKKRKISKAIRDSRLKEDPENLRNKEKQTKRISRKKQRKENPSYENPRIKEKDIYEDILEEDEYSKRFWKYKKYEKLQEKLFGKETIEDWKKRIEKEKELYGNEDWELKMERYEKIDLDRKIKKQLEKEKEFQERNKNIFCLKLSIFDNPN